jgi:hypothetical protein
MLEVVLIFQDHSPNQNVGVGSNFSGPKFAIFKHLYPLFFAFNSLSFFDSIFERRRRLRFELNDDKLSPLVHILTDSPCVI